MWTGVFAAVSTFGWALIGIAFLAILHLSLFFPLALLTAYMVHDRRAPAY